MTMDARICEVCGRDHAHYGGIHEPNMIDFRWKGFAHDSVTVMRFELCSECCAAIMERVTEMQQESTKGSESQ